MENQLVRFPSIEQYRNAARNIQRTAQFKGLDENQEPIFDPLVVLPKLVYIGTTKCHGSNASLVINPDGTFYCQSRERIIKVGDDNYGFAGFINDLNIINPGVVKLLHSCAGYGKKVVFYGEWCGKGIQNKVAISQVDYKFWVIFAAAIVNEESEKEEWVDLSQVDYSWLNIHKIFNIYQTKIWEIEIDFEHPAESIDQINKWVLEVEEECPLAKQLFGISGVGEGIVWKPADKEYSNSKYIFKVKGDKHAGSHVKHLVNIDVEKVKSAEEFVDKVVHEERLVQGFNHIIENGMFDEINPLKSLGDYLRWIFNDIIKEENELLTESGLNQKDVSGVIAKKAKIWYFNKIK